MIATYSHLLYWPALNFTSKSNSPRRRVTYWRRSLQGAGFFAGIEEADNRVVTQNAAGSERLRQTDAMFLNLVDRQRVLVA